MVFSINYHGTISMYMEKINFDPLQRILFKVDQSSQYKCQNKKRAEGK